MSTDLNQLVEQIYTYFQQTYRLDGANAAPGGLFLAFEKIGSSVSPEDFKLNPGDAAFNAAVIQQHGSHLVDFVADLDDQGFIQARGDLSPTVEGQYQQLLNVARPSANGDQQTAFLQQLGQAQRLLDEQTSTVNFDDFLPVQFTPQFWFNPADAANWATYSTSSSPALAQPSTPPVKIPPWKWRMVTPEARVQWAELRSAALAQERTPARPITHLTMPVLLVAPAPAPAAPVNVRLSPVALKPERLSVRAGAVRRFSPELLRTVAHVAVATPTPADAAVAPAFRDRKIRSAYSSIAVHEAIQLPEATPSSDGFSVSFEYCLVTIARPWVSSTFLTQPGWHVPGEATASWALGKYDSVTQRFGYLPAKMLVVRNLKITARWSQEDLSRIQGSAAAIGPFSLLNYQFNSGTLSVPGMQIVAWLCQVMPVLPPASDPATA
jgi:hypothetical protein